MAGRNLYEVKDSKLTPTEVERLMAGAKYIYGLANNTKITIPFKTTIGTYQNDYLVYADLRNASTRIKNFITKEKKNPAYVNVKPKASTTPTIVTTQATSTKGYFQKLFEARLGSVTNAKQATEKVRSLGYSGYSNAYEIAKQGKSQGSVVANFNRLGKTAMNCCDYTAILVTLFLEMGYDARVVQIQCSGVTHLLLQIRGKEYGNTWTYIDPAPMASKSGGYCAFGKVCWCATNGIPKKIVAINPKWFFNMYPDDLLK